MSEQEEMGKLRQARLEWAYRIATVIMTLILLPTFGWVWATDRAQVALGAEVEVIRSQVNDLDSDLDEVSEDTDQILVMQRDIEHIRESVDEIKQELRED